MLVVAYCIHWHVPSYMVSGCLNINREIPQNFKVTLESAIRLGVVRSCVSFRTMNAAPHKALWVSFAPQCQLPVFNYLLLPGL